MLVTSALMIILSSIALYLGIVYVQTSRDIATMNAELVRRKEMRHTKEAVPPNAQQLELEKAQNKEANEVIDRLSTPWDTLFRIFESTVDEDTVLLELEPQADQNEVQVTAESRNFSTMLDFVRRLQESPSLHDVYVSSHQVQQQDPQHPVRFVVNAKWDRTLRDQPAKKTVK